MKPVFYASILCASLVLSTCNTIHHSAHAEPPIYAEPQHQHQTGILNVEYTNYDNDDLHWMALNLYHEARGEPIRGQMAVAFVTMNRVHHPRFPDTIKGVIQEPNQFTWYSDGKSDKPRNAKMWREAKEIAALSLEL